MINFSIKCQRTLVIYLMSEGVTKIFPTASTLAIVYMLTPEDFGKSILFVSIVSILSSLSSFGVASILVRDKGRVEDDEYKKIYSSSIFLVFISSFLVIGCYLFFVLFFGGYQGVFYTLYLFLSSLSLSIFSVFIKNLVVSGEKEMYFKINFLKSSLLAVLTVLFVFIENSYWGRLYGVGFSSLILLVLVLRLIGGDFSRFSFFHLKVVVVYCTRMIPQLISNLIKIGLDKVLISVYFTSDELGFYGFYFTVCSAFMVVGQSLNNSYLPTLLSAHRTGDLLIIKKEEKKIISMIFLFFIVFSSISFVFFKFFSPEKYVFDFYAYFFLSLSFLFNSLYLVYMKVFVCRDKMLLLGGGNIISLAIYLFGIVFLSSFGVFLLYFIYSVSVFLFVFLYRLGVYSVWNGAGIKR
ncbi:lipopolysaccharide biosynthesis protein [Marinomonas sp. TW1]|uniref:lipopolysaccharide biosynthesis protein n=1 Tax=Marinomonas sp. TW1 TaxID=1561203 RepID=UPI0007AF5443|nr:oligosaccharide flippase family protein [Marinomonas sp. TW1]KZN15071.1 hypothetical protein OA79_02400 [Marinomonas sp. TW1]